MPRFRLTERAKLRFNADFFQVLNNPGIPTPGSNGILSTQNRALANEFQYHYLLALAALERITAGGFNPGFETIPPAKP